MKCPLCYDIIKVARNLPKTSFEKSFCGFKTKKASPEGDAVNSLCINLSDAVDDHLFDSCHIAVHNSPCAQKLFCNGRRNCLMNIETLDAESISALDVRVAIVADHNTLALLETVSLKEDFVDFCVGL